MKAARNRPVAEPSPSTGRSTTTAASLKEPLASLRWRSRARPRLSSLAFPNALVNADEQRRLRASPIPAAARAAEGGPSLGLL